MKVIKGLIIGCLALGLVGCSNNDTKTEKKISLEEAKTAALKHANLSEDSVTFNETGGETDNGVFHYDIEFSDNDGKSYDYQINGNNGEIIKFDHNMTDNNQTTSSTQDNITLDKAKTIAIEHAKAKENEVTFTESKQDKDDGVDVFELKFYDLNVSYEYELKVADGEICSYSHKKKTKNNSTSTITLDKAKEIALKDAKVINTNISFITAKEDSDDGVKVYELKFQNNGKTYDYEIEKATGDIRGYEVK